MKALIELHFQPNNKGISKMLRKHPSMLPGTSLVWSSILPRMKWRYSENLRNMEITRKRVNRGFRSYLLKIGGITANGMPL
jgi:hypothetical protein